MENKLPSSDAMDDLLAFMALAKNVPSAADAFKECCELGLSVVVCHLDRDATVVAGKPIFHFQLHERLMRHLSAFRTRKIEAGSHEGVGG